MEVQCIFVSMGYVCLLIFNLSNNFFFYLSTVSYYPECTLLGNDRVQKGKSFITILPILLLAMLPVLAWLNTSGHDDVVLSIKSLFLSYYIKLYHLPILKVVLPLICHPFPKSR